MQYNSATILEEAGFSPERAYYCEGCGGWHITSQSMEVRNGDPTERNRLVAIHKKASLRKKNTNMALDSVERYIAIAIDNFRKGKKAKSIKIWGKAYKLYVHTLGSEYCMNRKLALFNQLSTYHELVIAC